MINGNALFHYLSSRDSVELTQLRFPGFACFASSFLTFGPSGNLYGVYTVGDAPGAAGIFELQPDDSHLQLLPEFTTTTGAGPQLPLGSDGNFWFPQVVGTSSKGDLVAIAPATGAVVRTLTPFNASAFGPSEIIQAKGGRILGSQQRRDRWVGALC